jgi:adenosylmethionine---8-amino-7-oxononanoate aminotransferase
MNDISLNPDLNADSRYVWHPCTPSTDIESVAPLLIERASGVYLYDVEGKSYLDAISSWWVNLFGHNHPRLNVALKNQLEKMAHVMFAGVTHRPAIELARKLIERTPENLQRVFFSDNGSTSIEVALKMSLQFWKQTGKEKKNRFVYLKGGYHGETLGALSVCGIDLFRNKFEDVLADNIEVEGPDCFHCPFGLNRESCQAECFESMEKVLTDQNSTIAGVLVEPLVQGAAGMKMYPPIYLKKLEDACKSVDVHIIFDEIAVGFGRTGSLFVCESNGLQPDFLCLSKGITSGYLPLSVTLTSEKIYSAFYGKFENLDWFVHSHSYTANPLACAIANETMNIFAEPNFFSELNDKITTLNVSCAVFKNMAYCGEYRQTGLIGAVELQKKDGSAFAFEERIGYQIYLEGLKRGVFMRPLGSVIYFMPPLSILATEIEFLVEVARKSILTVMEK